MNNRRFQGSQWEKLAESFLHKRGLRTLERNYHSRFGEIDLIMMDRQTLVFTEVRYRSDSAFGSGAESVTFTKQKPSHVPHSDSSSIISTILPWPAVLMLFQ